MAIDTYQQTLNQITSLVYQEIFGMTRDEMLAEGKKHTPAGLQGMSPDKDENMRDRLSIAALNSLTGAEKAVAAFVNHHGQSLTCDFYLSYLPRIIKPYYIDGLVIWDDES